ncbi:MAG: hypothetical protein VX277_03350 [Candidatus Thermoplasmatota archaeon]|nr:hypothetical protein [Candidatus Thermoplasmatota archaeon]
MMEPPKYRDFNLSYPDLRSLKCPLCDERICVYGTNCEIEACEKHHMSAHDTEEGNELKKFLKINYNSSAQNFLISFIVGDDELLNLLKECLQEYSNISTRINSRRAPKKKLEYADAMVLLAIELNNSEIIERLHKKHPSSKHWPSLQAKEFFNQISELMEEYSLIAGFHPRKEDFEKKIHSILLRVFKSKTKVHDIKTMIKKILNNYGPDIQSKMKLIDWLIKHENKISTFNQWIPYLWWHEIRSKDEISKLYDLDIRYLEKMLMRAMQKKRNMDIDYTLCHSLGYDLFIRAKKRIPGDPYAVKKMPEIIGLLLQIFEKMPEVSSYISFLDQASNFDLPEVTFPKWLDEKLINAPENIPKFKSLCEKLGVRYNFMKLSKKIPLTSFSKVLNYNHLSDIIGTRTNFIDENEINYAESIEYGGDGKILDFEEYLEPKLDENDIILDFPNIIAINWDKTLPKETGFKILRGNMDLWIDWINLQKSDCYIHTTSSACSKNGWFIDKIQKRTKAKFLYYDFNEELDEDLFYIKFALQKKAVMITRDKFHDHEINFPTAVFMQIKLASRLEPQLNELGEIEIIEKA